MSDESMKANHNPADALRVLAERRGVDPGQAKALQEAVETGHGPEVAADENVTAGIVGYLALAGQREAIQARSIIANEARADLAGASYVLATLKDMEFTTKQDKERVTGIIDGALALTSSAIEVLRGQSEPANSAPGS